MSAIVLEYRRDGAPADHRAAAAMLDRLDHRGPDGRDLVVVDQVALGCQYFWTVPEEVGRTQPVVRGRSLVAFDGRIDNRRELLEALDLDRSHSRDLADAELVQDAFRAWGAACFDRFIGPFAVVVWDHATQTVFAARDGLGDRTLFYRLDPNHLIVASEEHALLAHPGVSSRLDEDRIAHHFAIQIPDDGSTFFAEITELRPAEVLAVTRDRVRGRRCWNPQPAPDIARLSDNDCVDRYRELLADSVRCRLRSTTPATVVMSGGLDSTSIAAAGARELQASGKDRRMRAVSWVFDDLVACDERPFIDAVVDHCGIEAQRVPGDDAWPLADPAVVSRNPSTPEQNPYRELKRRAFRGASDAGSRVVLSGCTSDLFSYGGEMWMWDLLGSGRLIEAATSLATDVTKRGVLDALRMAGFGIPLRPFRRRPSPVLRAPWATETTRRMVDADENDPWWRTVFPRHGQCSAVLGAREARGVSLETFDGARVGVEIRYPYRDRRLTEFMLSVPAHQLYRRGRYKHLARAAAAGLLPPEIPARTTPTLLTPLFRKGVFEREYATVCRILNSGDAAWPRFVDRGWIDEILRVGPRRSHDDILLWHCVGFEFWLRRHGWACTARQQADWPVSLTENAA